jgi:hypothetical protein
MLERWLLARSPGVVAGSSRWLIARMSSMTTLGADHATVVAGHNAVSRYKKLTGTMSLEQTDHSLILSQR